jgi:hypothetical protein
MIDFLAVFLYELKDTVVLYYAVVCTMQSSFRFSVWSAFVSNNFVCQSLQELCTSSAVAGFTNMTSCQTRVALPRVPLTPYSTTKKRKGFLTIADTRRREGWQLQQVRAFTELEVEPRRDEDLKPLKSHYNLLNIPSEKEVVLSSISAVGAAKEETISTAQKHHPLSRERDHTPRALLLLGGLLIAAACALLGLKDAVAS